MEILVIDGIPVPVHSLAPINELHTVEGGSSFKRMMNGRLVKQQNWQKQNIVFTGSGTKPLGLAVDFSQSYIIKSSSPLGVRSLSNQITVPSGRRTDAGYMPKGMALIGMEWVETTIGFAADLATLGVVGGATQYEVLYYPELTVMSDPPEETVDSLTGQYTWTLEVREV